MSGTDVTSGRSWALELFWQVGTYRSIRRLRRRVGDLLIAVPLSALGLVWEWRRSDTRPLPTNWAESPGHAWVVVSQQHQGPRWLDPDMVLPVLDQWINGTRAMAWFPVLLAVVVFLVLRGRVKGVLNDVLLVDPDDQQDTPTRRDWVELARKLLLVPVVAIAASVYLLWDGYGDWSARYVPLLVAVGAAFLVGRMDSTVSRRPRTNAGCRVPMRTLLSRRGRRAVREVAFQHALFQAGAGWWNVDVVEEGRPPEPYSEDDEHDGGRARRREWFLQRAWAFRDAGGAASLGWYTGWAIDMCVNVGDLETAEDLLRGAADVAGAADTRSCRAAEAALLDVVGAPSLAAEQWRKAMEGPGRVPLALRVRAERCPAFVTSKGRAPSAWRLTRLAWFQTGQLLVTELAGRLQEDWPGPAEDRGVARLDELIDAVGAAALLDDTDVYAGAARDKAAALYSLGEARAAAGRTMPAADAHLAAVDAYLTLRDPSGVGRALASACLAFLSHPRLRATEAQHALDLLRVALGLMEQRRAALRDPDRRSAVARQDEPLHDAVLDLVAEDRHCDAAARAELALWLMESRRRSIRDHVLTDAGVPDDAEFAAQWRELESREAEQHVPPPHSGWAKAWEEALSAPELADAKANVWATITALHAALPAPTATDMSSSLRRAGDAVVLTFRTRRTPSAGWTVDTVMAAPGFPPRLYRAVLPAARRHDGDPVSVAHDACLTLDALHSGDHAAVSHLIRNVGCDLLAWKDIATAVLPPGLGRVLTTRRSTARRPVLIVVPDGPVAALPLAGLPLDDGELLGERALVTLAPSLAVLREPEPGGATGPSTQRVILHLDAHALKVYGQETDLHAGDARVRLSTDRASLIEELGVRPAADMALLAAHGELVRTPGAPDSGNECLPRLADGSTLSAATALGLAWPNTVLLGTCWVSRLDTAFGRDPVSFPMSCLLAGARTVAGATGPVQDKVASDVFGGSTAEALGGRDLWDSFHLRLRRHLRDGFGDAAAPVAGPGIAVWTVQPPVAPAPTTHRPLWDRDGLTTGTARSDDSPFHTRTGHELLLPTASEALSIALRHAAGGARPQQVVDTLGLALAIAATDPVGRWEDFADMDGGAGPATLPLSEQSTVDVVLADGTWVEATVTVAVALEIAELLRRHLDDEWLHPQHAVYGLMHIEETDGPRPSIFFHASPRRGRQKLAAHAFNGADLPHPDELSNDDHHPGPQPPADDDLAIRLRGLGRQYLKMALIAAAVAGIILGFFLPDMARIARTPSLGAQFRPVRLSTGEIVNEVIWTVDGGPANAAGLHPGDIMTAHGSLPDGRTAMIVSSPVGTPLRRLTLTPVAPRCLVMRC
ncbi:CHAT domain-containing protein [Streptomyces sp. NPDC057950]|uniref:CHAT domain-containing protein n=1 Tax=Streptomyces sp. NPDC057950 TaxID=3346288 RepID=UPI0036E77933